MKIDKKGEEYIKIIKKGSLKVYLNNYYNYNYFSNKKAFNKLIYIIFIIFIIICFIFLFCSLIIFKIKDIKQEKLVQELSNFKSFSQCFEDLILFCIFYDIRKGFYIDIGANDPNIISVTKAFYLRGWYGINIEPLPNKIQELMKYRKRDINLQIGVGEKKGIARLFEKESGSTLFKEYSSNNSQILNIHIDTMLNICNKYLPKKEVVQFCKIDIEGGEKEALLGYDFENCRPKVFCIESTKPGSYIPTFEQWENILFKNDYSFVYQYEINRYYSSYLLIFL